MRYVQLTGFIFLILIGWMGLDAAILLKNIHIFLSPITDWTIGLLWVATSVDTFSAKYDSASDVLILSWFVASLILITGLINIFLMLIFGKNIQKTDVNLDLKLVQLEIYRKIFFKWFDPSNFLLKENERINHQNIKLNLHIDDWDEGRQWSSLNLLRIGFNNYVVQRQLIISLVVLTVLFSLFSFSHLPGGFLGYSPILFYLGYPIIIFTISLYVIELLMYLPIIFIAIKNFI